MWVSTGGLFWAFPFLSILTAKSPVSRLGLTRLLFTCFNSLTPFLPTSTRSHIYVNTHWHLTATTDGYGIVTKYWFSNTSTLLGKKYGITPLGIRYRLSLQDFPFSFSLLSLFLNGPNLWFSSFGCHPQLSLEFLFVHSSLLIPTYLYLYLHTLLACLLLLICHARGRVRGLSNYTRKAKEVLGRRSEGQRKVIEEIDGEKDGLGEDMHGMG